MVSLELQDERWWDFVNSCDDAWPFHHPAWGGTLAECYRYPAWAIAIEAEDGSLAAGLPVIEVRSLTGHRRRSSLPFTDFCAPLASDSQSLEELGATIAREGLGAPDIPGDIKAGLPGMGDQAQSGFVMHTLQMG